MIWNPDAETMAPESRRALQLARLRDTVDRAATHVPFFRAALATAGVGAGSVRALEDLARLPFTRKDHLREQYPWGLFAVPRHELARIHASSGTTGKPTVVGYTRRDLDIWREVMARSLAAGGAEPGHLIQIAYGYGLFTGGLGFHDGAEHMGLTVVPVSSGNTLRQILLLQDFRPHGLACTPSFALHIGEALREAGQDPRGLGLRYGLFGAEPWTEGMRAQLEALWGMVASDFYGLSELIGPGVASEPCPMMRGFQLRFGSSEKMCRVAGNCWSVYRTGLAVSGGALIQARADLSVSSAYHLSNSSSRVARQRVQKPRCPGGGQRHLVLMRC